MTRATNDFVTYMIHFSYHFQSRVKVYPNDTPEIFCRTVDLASFDAALANLITAAYNEGEADSCVSATVCGLRAGPPASPMCASSRGYDFPTPGSTLPSLLRRNCIFGVSRVVFGRIRRGPGIGGLQCVLNTRRQRSKRRSRRIPGADGIGSLRTVSGVLFSLVLRYLYSNA